MKKKRGGGGPHRKYPPESKSEPFLSKAKTQLLYKDPRGGAGNVLM